MENTGNLEEKWPRVKEQLKKEHPQLTEGDLHYDAGQEEELVRRLHEKLNRTKREIRNWLHIMG